jgi:hypothetical protein
MGAARGQTFQYEAKPKVTMGGMAYASPDAAPTMMVPSEAVGAPLGNRRYFDRRYGTRMAQRPDAESIAPGSRSRVRSWHNSAPEPITLGKPSGPSMEAIPPGVPQGSTVEGDWGYGPPPSGEFGDPVEGPYDEDCGEDCDEPNDRLFPCIRNWYHHSILFAPQTWQNFNEFGGVQAFKSPVDLGVNGNFGFHKGVNYAAPFIEPLGLGYQIGGLIAVSDFAGGSGVVSHQRDQYFVTGGLFHRATCNSGFQAGVVADYLRDNFYVSMNILQVRAELSYLRYCNEIGFWTAVHTNTDTQAAPSFLQQSTVTWQANNQYNVFFRRRFCNGGFGRMWIGLTNYGDVLWGSDVTAVLSETWALQAAYNYLLPRQDPTIPNAIKETWGVNFSLVWYPGFKVPKACFSPYRPLFTVADNSSLLLMQK